MQKKAGETTRREDLKVDLQFRDKIDEYFT